MMFSGRWRHSHAISAAAQSAAESLLFRIKSRKERTDSNTCRNEVHRSLLRCSALRGASRCEPFARDVMQRPSHVRASGG
jgi:hypothetical protein